MTLDGPKVSVVIPCYNQGHYVDEAVSSVLAQTYQNFEIIVVNDGSTDRQTVDLLDGYDRPHTRVLHTTNQGLAAARNNGIAVANGAYILPLDADDKIAATYMEQAVKVLEADETVGIVYCEATYFGDKSGPWELPAYSLAQLLIENMIFCTSFFRKADWIAVGGYNSNMVYGWEDYDFWMSLVELGREVYRIPAPLFHYRVRANSMSNSLSQEQYISLSSQLFRNHIALYKNNIEHFFAHVFKLGEELGKRFQENEKLKEENDRLVAELALLRAEPSRQGESSRLLHTMARGVYSFLSERPRLEARARSLAYQVRRIGQRRKGTS